MAVSSIGNRGINLGTHAVVFIVRGGGEALLQILHHKHNNLKKKGHARG